MFFFVVVVYFVFEGGDPLKPTEHHNPSQVSADDRYKHSRSHRDILSNDLIEKPHIMFNTSILI